VALLAGDLLQGRYRIAGPLAQGGMGAVFLAHEEASGAARVVKQLRLDAPELLDSFRGEFALLSRLSHPYLARVLDLGSERLRGEVLHYYVAEHVEGSTLGERARSGASSQDLLRPLLDALEGLSVLHGARIRHGDLSPANVLVRTDGSGVLIDLGCARAFGPCELLAGTEGYLAPELLESATGDARADLFALGVTIRNVWALAGLPLSGALEPLVKRLLRTDVNQRPADVAEVLETLGRRPKPQKQLFLPTELLDRERELAQFQAWLDALLAGSNQARVLSIQGPPGVGSTRFVRELCWRAQLFLPVWRVRAGEAGLGRLLARALGHETLAGGARGALAVTRGLGERSEPLLFVVEDYERLPSDERELLLALARLLADSGPLALLVSGDRPPTDIAVEALALRPLDLPALRRWTQGTLSERKLQELLHASAGLPVRIEAALRAGLTTERTASPSASQRAVPSTRVAASSKPILSQILALGGEASLSSLELEWSALEPLLAESALERDGESVRLNSALKLALESGALSDAELREGHRRVAKRLEHASADGDGLVVFAQLIHHYSLGGELGRAEGLLLERAAAFRRTPRALLEGARALLDRTLQIPVLLLGAELLLAAGQARSALRAASRAARLKPTAAAALAATLLASDALVRLGRPARAELLLTRILAKNPDKEAASAILERLARARLARGDYAGAQQITSQALALEPPSRVAGLLRETSGVAFAYSGDLAQAERELALALESLGKGASPREQSRILSHRAMVAFRQGRVEPALASYTSALGIAEDQDQEDLIATGLLNLGTAEQQAGQWGNALAHYERGMLFARALGRVTTELSLQFNLANLYSELGAFERAEHGLAELARRAQAAKLQHFGPAVALVRAEMHLAQGALREANEQLTAAAAELERRGQPRESLEVGLRQADVALTGGDLEAAAQRLDALTEAAPADSAVDLHLGISLLRARLESRRGERAALGRLESARLSAERAGLLGSQALMQDELALAARQLGEPELAAKHDERTRRLWDRIAIGLPAALSSVFWRHPRRARLAQSSRVFAPAARGSADSEAYRRLLALNRRLNSSLSVDRVLEYAVQAAVDLTGAERGFLVLRADAADSQKEPQIVVQRSTEPDVSPSQGPSRNIVLRTLEREEAVLTTDAQGDARFLGHGSVHALRLKSVLSVPVLSPTGTLGVLYVDSRVQRARFSEHERELLTAFADQLAIALGNARLHAELEQKTLELAEQKRAIEQLSRGQARQIERLQKQVSTQQQSLEYRYDYSQIVGRGPAMRRVLERLERVIDSEISLLVLGDSGTGKELVARAVHFNGARKAGPFQGINCAALPETLLEAELFGSVKGAFTGADRDKQGLMPAANGGTLFLDEVGELPLSTQAKLLRVLQEREVRPLGAARPVALDIRLICATHRDLLGDVASGRFREDLYYHIAVVSVDLPPLRERLEDLAELSAKILAGLARNAQRTPPELAQEALRRLSAHPFPGNVRELQNVLTRAFVLATGPKIQAEDIDLGVARARGPRAGSRRDYETQERERILESLRGARWNVSIVSRTLGIPRNTLYRKLARYGIARDPLPDTE
jgi:serine/threonine-protein kinase PknK